MLSITAIHFMLNLRRWVGEVLQLLIVVGFVDYRWQLLVNELFKWSPHFLVYCVILLVCKFICHAIKA